ncbi:hypothetical protein AVEN_224144-1 [Araneus ventricosus]|uniref:Uncharacterized protein n=1 Tax=Araneus ventricosus TaxID=182803 RepID=A0A4Y2HDB2_ARAVE|nr:hypothetical protein AVEN_224144-1 [Araneus ventricosus]
MPIQQLYESSIVCVENSGGIRRGRQIYLMNSRTPFLPSRPFPSTGSLLLSLLVLLTPQMSVFRQHNLNLHIYAVKCSNLKDGNQSVTVRQKHFLAIEEIRPDMQHFLNHQPKSKLIFPQFFQPKERRSNPRLAMCFCFGIFNGTRTKGAPLEEEEAFKLDHILGKTW